MRKVFAAIFVAVFASLASVAIAAEEGPTPEGVAFMQGLLLRLGYDPGPVDGICGNRTATAVRSFHEAHYLPLQSGDIEPQGATVVKNLKAAFAEYVMRPQTSVPEVYHQALAGSAEAAIDVGMMYRSGESTAGDEMLAYLWWSVAEATGNIEAAKLKDGLVAIGEISDHEMSYAVALAEQIRASTAHADDKPPKADDKLSADATM